MFQPASLQPMLPVQLEPSSESSPSLPALDDDLEDELQPMFSLAGPHLSSPILEPNEAQECTGVLVHWTPGSVWDTYPYHQHSIRTLP